MSNVLSLSLLQSHHPSIFAINQGVVTVIIITIILLLHCPPSVVIANTLQMDDIMTHCVDYCGLHFVCMCRVNLHNGYIRFTHSFPWFTYICKVFAWTFYNGSALSRADGWATVYCIVPHNIKRVYVVNPVFSCFSGFPWFFKCKACVQESWLSNEYPIFPLMNVPLHWCHVTSIDFDSKACNTPETNKTSVSVSNGKFPFIFTSILYIWWNIFLLTGRF